MSNRNSHEEEVTRSSVQSERGDAEAGAEGGTASSEIKHAPPNEENMNMRSNSSKSEGQETKSDDSNTENSTDPPLPNETAPPLPSEAPPDDGWDPVWDPNAGAYYFYNRFTQASQWTNPRVPDASQPGVGNYDRIPLTSSPEPQQQLRPYGGYDPAIHGDYDPTASYAQEDPSVSTTALGEEGDISSNAANAEAAGEIYTATGVFNRFTGKWQPHHISPENHNDENKSRRQMGAFFDVDKAANAHDGRSLKAERQGKKLSKKEVKEFREKRRERKEEKRRAWLRD